MDIYLNEFEMIELRDSDLPQGRAFVNGYRSRRHSLTGKVVMLIASDAASVEQLAMQLAERGADIALVTIETSYRTARQLRDRITELGQRFIYIHTTLDHNGSAEDTMQTVLSQYEHIDVFIDLAAERRKEAEETGRITPAAFLTDWALTEAAIREIAR